MLQTFGYVRVSTKDQNEARQLDALAAYAIPKSNLYVDKQSGKDFCRPAYRKLMRRLRPGDLLIVKSIDRLGRDYDEILEEWRVITKEKCCDILILDMPLLDTREKGQDLTGKFISDLVLQILSYVAQTEREFIRSRQAEGITAARARGVPFGRPRKEPPPEYDALYLQWVRREISANQAAKQLGVACQTFISWARADEERMVKRKF